MINMKNIIDELIEKNVSEMLESLAVGAMWMPSFGWFQKTHEKELTLKIRIHRQSVDTLACIEKVKLIVESMGWTYKVAEDVKEVGVVN